MSGALVLRAGTTNLIEASWMNCALQPRTIPGGDQGIRDTESGGGGGYTPKYDGEAFYLGFDDGEFKEMVSYQMMTVVGTPGFAGEGKVGDNAYMPAADSYLLSLRRTYGR